MMGQAVMVQICAMCIMGLCMCFGPLRIDAVNSDTCKDFYSYACKDFRDSGFLRRNRGTDRAKYVARAEFSKNEEDSPFKSYYQSCLRREGSERFLITKMKEIIRGTHNGNQLNVDDIAKLLDETATLDNAFFETGFDHKDKNKFVIAGRRWLEKSEIDKKSEFYENYKDFVKKVFSDLDTLYDEKEWMNVLRLEQEIIEAVNKKKNISYYFNNEKLFYNENEERYSMTLLNEKLIASEWASKFNLTKFLQYFHDRISSGVVHSKVGFMGLAYFKELQEILGGYSFNIIARYVILRSTLALYYTLPQRFQDMPSDDVSRKLNLQSWLPKDESHCHSEAIFELQYLEEQFYMDKIFSGQTGNMANALYESIGKNWGNNLRSDPCMPNDKTGEIIKKMRDMTVHLGRFELPYFQYKKTSFYNGSYFENVLASKRDFIQTIADGEKGFGFQNLTSFQRARKTSYYDDHHNELYIFSYVFNTTTQHASEFFGAAGPHVVEALFNAFNKEDFKKCSGMKKKKIMTPTPRTNPEEYFLGTKLNLSVKAYQSQEPKGTEADTQKFFTIFAQEFCSANGEDKDRLNKILSANEPFQTAFKCSSS